MDNPKYKEGDRVRIIKYGHLMHGPKAMFPGMKVIVEEGGNAIFDMSPALVGQIGVVVKVSIPQPGLIQYSLAGPNKTAWYNEDQLEPESNVTQS